MPRYYKICAISIMLFVIALDSVAFKSNKEYKKTTELKNKGKYEESFFEDEKDLQTKHHRTLYQNDFRRPVRSIRSAKVRVHMEEPVDEKIQYVYGKEKKVSRLADDALISRKIENSCGKKSDCEILEKRKLKVSHLSTEGVNGRKKSFRDKKEQESNTKHMHLTPEKSDVEEELSPEDFEYGVKPKKFQKVKKIPAFLILEDSGADFLNEEHVIKSSGKTSRNQVPRFIIETENEIDLGNTMENQPYWPLENSTEGSDTDSSLSETDEEYEGDFL